MIAVLYRVILKHGKEEAFRQLWEELSNYYIAEKGALGSTLHKTDENIWIAYSRWPSKELRDSVWPGHGEPSNTLPEHVREVILRIKEYVDVEFPETVMTVVDETREFKQLLSALRDKAESRILN